MNNYSTEFEKSQDLNANEPKEILEDRSASGRVRPWKEKKEGSMYLSEIYSYEDLITKALDAQKADRVKACASYLTFKRIADGGLKLLKANFCRCKLCPMCVWRRSLKVYGQLKKIFDNLPSDTTVVALTLTIKNCSDETLSQTIEKLLVGFNRLIKYKQVKTVCQGFYRAMEITRNNEDAQNRWHPHLHCLMVVDKKYFSSRSYIKHEELIELWRRALKADYDPSVRISRLKAKRGQGIGQALCEFAKYTVKDSDCLTGNIIEDIATVRLLDTVLAHCRFIGMGGIIRDLHKQLNLTDVEESQDLVHVGDDESVSDEAEEIVSYKWTQSEMQAALVLAGGVHPSYNYYKQKLGM